MASKTVTRKFVDGSEKTFQRKKQGRKPSGLGKLDKYRLYESDEKRLLILKDKLGKYYNKNEIVRSAVKIYLDNFVPLTYASFRRLAWCIFSQTKQPAWYANVNQCHGFVYVCCPLACWLTKYALDGWYAPRPQAVFWLVILSPRGD